MVKSIKSRAVVTKTILGGNTLAVCIQFPPKLHDVTFGRRSNPLRVVSLFLQLFPLNTTFFCKVYEIGFRSTCGDNNVCDNLA